MSLKYSIFKTFHKYLKYGSIFEKEDENLIYDFLINNRTSSDGKGSKIPKNLNIKTDIIDGCKVLKLIPKKLTNNNIVVYLHSGGHAAEMLFIHWYFIRKLSKKTGSIIYIPIYPLTPEHDCRATIKFLEHFYRKIQDKYDNICLLGESSGASLTLSLSMMIRDLGLKEPKNITLISPCSILNVKDEENKEIYKEMQEISKQEVIISINAFPTLMNLWKGPYDNKHYWVSPYYGDFHNLKNITLITGTNQDIMYPINKRLYKKMIENHVENFTYIERDLCHDFIVFCSKESKDIFNQIVNNITK